MSLCCRETVGLCSCAVVVRHVCVQNNSDVESGRSNRRELPMFAHRPRSQPRIPGRSQGLLSDHLTHQEHDQEVCIRTYLTLSVKLVWVWNSELSTCLFQFSHKTRQLKQCCCTLILLPKSTLNANLTTNRFFTNDGWQRGRFENFKSDHQYKSNLESDVRFKIESNHEASQVPKNYTTVCPNLTDLWRHHEQCYSSSQNVSQRPVKVWINTLSDVFSFILELL